MTSSVDLIMYVCLYIPCPSVFEISICIGPLLHIVAIQTELQESTACMENFFIGRDILTKLDK